MKMGHGIPDLNGFRFKEDKMAKKKSKRIVYRVQWKKGLKAWTITRNNKKIEQGWPKKIVVAEARFKAQYLEPHGPTGTQLVIYRMDGTIQSERIYNKDPKRSKS